MANKKITLAFLIILLIIFLPLTIFSTYLKLSGYKTEEKHEVVEKKEEKTNTNNTSGKLDFYNSNNELIGSYTCKTTSCSFAKSYIDDKNFTIDYLANKEEDIKIINDKYAFINDNKTIYLYDILNNKELETYKNVKNYNNMTGNIFIVQNNEDKWGVISLEEEIKPVIDFKYDFIGLINNINENNILDTSYYVVYENSIWGIIDNTGVLMSNYLAGEISSYNNLLISTKKDDTYYLYDYYGKRVVDENGFNYVSFTDKYINIVDKNNNLYVYEYGTNNRKVGSSIKLDNNNYKEAFTSVFNKDTNTIDLTVNGKTYNLHL